MACAMSKVCGGPLQRQAAALHGCGRRAWPGPLAHRGFQINARSAPQPDRSASAQSFGLNRVRPDGASLDAPALAANFAASAGVGRGAAAEVSITIRSGQAPARLPSTARNAALIRGEVEVPMWMMAYFTTSAAVKKGAGQSTQAHVKLIAREGGFSMIVVIKGRHGSLKRDLPGIDKQI
jgi:hypothetical protein